VGGKGARVSDNTDSEWKIHTFGREKMETDPSMVKGEQKCRSRKKVLKKLGKLGRFAWGLIDKKCENMQKGNI